MMTLNMWFLNVGHGDCTIIRFPSGRVMMVDIHNSKPRTPVDDIVDTLMRQAAAQRSAAQSLFGGILGSKSSVLLEDPVDFVRRTFPCEAIFRLVITHPDADHLGGLHRLCKQEPGVNVLNVWDTANTKKLTEFQSDAERLDWEAYQEIRSGMHTERVLQLHREQTGHYWSDDGVAVLSPTPERVSEANEAKDWHRLCYVLRITYGKASVILASDASVELQNELVELYGSSLKSTLLRAPHHGTVSACCPEFMKATLPRYTIVSNACEPDHDASAWYGRYSQRVLSTWQHGTMSAAVHADGRVDLFDWQGQPLSSATDHLRELVVGPAIPLG